VENLLVLLGIKKDLNSAFKEAYEQGDSIQVDLTVGDIYGDKLDFQLPKNLLAATMGKA
jgi:pantothenate kinase